VTAVGAGVGQWFGAVADAFRGTSKELGEEAAAVTVFRGGTKIVDLWAGVDVVNQRPMPRDGLMMVASCSKGITATVVAMLVERGLLDPGERVATYWSEFAADGKEQATNEMVAAQIVGLPYPPLGTGLQGLDEHRREAVTKALVAAPPLWAPVLSPPSPTARC
jgi:CubicO group peptidase (beta-lactamase class C family)